MAAAPLRIPLTLSDLVGPGHRFVARASDRRSRWLPQDAMLRDALGGSLDLLRGSMPTLAAAATRTARVHRLRALAGLPMLDEGVETFRDAADFQARLAAFTAPGGVVVQHVFPSDELSVDRYWIDPELLSHLNDKANLAEFVPPAAVPERRLFDVAVLDEPLPLPCVVKAATDDSTGGGNDVVICRTPSDVDLARRRFAAARRVVVEELLAIDRSFCLNFGISRSAAVQYLGAAEQICRSDGRFAGNWIDDSAPSPAAIDYARVAAERAAALGYCGFAGIDVAITARGPFVIDLNFRVNASTLPLLLRDSIRARFGPVVLRAVRMEYASDPWTAIERDIEQGRLIPLHIYDPAGSAFPDRAPWVQGLLVRNSREEAGPS